jgi:hypothetical protein
MFTARRVAIVALPALFVFGLSGCSLLQAQDADSTPTGIAACALGHTWSLDTKDLATQVLADLKKQNVVATSVTADGKQTLTWAINGEVEIQSDYTVTVTVSPAADQSTVATQTHKGKATGKAYINAEVAIPRDWDASGTKVSTKFVVNGAELASKDPAPFVITQTAFDDEVGLELTCDGDTLTTHARGFPITQTWTKSD